METKKKWDLKKIIVVCLIVLLALSAIGVSVWYGYSRSTDVPPIGEGEDNEGTSKDDDSEDKQDEDEQDGEETETDDEKMDTNDVNENSNNDDTFDYEGFEGETPEDEEESESGSLDDMKEYPTDPVVNDKDWEV